MAAGRGTRMKSKKPKVLHEVHSRPMISFVIEALNEAGVQKKVVVVSPTDKCEIRRAFKKIDFVIQKKPLGSGNAVKETKKYFAKFKGLILIICGDTPLISKETIQKLIEKHNRKNPSCTLLTARAKNPSGYGRIIKDHSDNIIGIVEEKDLTGNEDAIDEINVGCYLFDKDVLFSHIDKVKINPKKKEYYLTDMIESLNEDKKRVLSVSCEDSLEYVGVNTRIDLAQAENFLRKKTLKHFMLEGVTIIDPGSTFIDKEAKIGKDTIIYPNTIIEKDVVIGSSCSIGPFAKIRQGTRLGNKVEIGSFVELVRTKIADGTKAKHLAYLGDAEIGKNVNIGAGAITANYDGKNKNKTIIGDQAFIGVGAILVAPIKIGKGALVGAGAVVTKGKNVAPGKTVIGVPARVLKK